MPRKTRDDYFQECLQEFLRVKLGEEMSEHAGDLRPLSRWIIRLSERKGGRNKGLVYSVELSKEIIVGGTYNGNWHETIRMNQYIPDSDTIKRVFQEAFGPFELWQNDKCVSSTRIVGVYDKTYYIKLVILIKYHKDYMPFFVDNLANHTICEMNRTITIQTIQMQHLRDVNNTLKYTEETMDTAIQALTAEKMALTAEKMALTAEKMALTAKLGACKYERKMREMYCAAATLEECPVCTIDIEKENLFIPPCAHFVCSSCSEKCSSCPICRGPLAFTHFLI